MMEDARGYIWQNDRIAGADNRIRRLEEGPDWEGRALCSLEIVRSHGENFAGPRHRRHEPDARERTPFARGQRSEEHTSELQSLMRNSYAVFCLQKKKERKNSEAISTSTARSS